MVKKLLRLIVFFMNLRLKMTSSSKYENFKLRHYGRPVQTEDQDLKKTIPMTKLDIHERLPVHCLAKEEFLKEHRHSRSTA